jgi:hypothetical protein
MTLRGLLRAFKEFARLVTIRAGLINYEVQMKKLILVALLMTGLTQAGCEFLAGTLVGAGAAGGGYEYQAYRQMQQLEEDYKNRRISREEYEDRKKQIEKGSIIY